LTAPPARNEVAALELRDVRAGYRDSQVLHGVTLSVRQSTVVTLLGPNGAGKTTLLKVASGLLRSASGTLCLRGTEITRRPAHDVAKAGVCHIPEGHGIYPSLSVRENISLFSPVQRPSELIDLAVDAFPALGKRLGQRAGTLSGGEQQMLALSRAYVGSPTVVLLDELSMGLAPKLVDEIFRSILKLKERQVSLLLVEQYVDRALEVADYVYVLNRGRVQADGHVKEFSRERVVSSYLGAK
jgi:branched-chain amino acid transport system ATP-binding protein